MLKHGVGKGRHVINPLHVCLRVLQYYATVATEHARYVLYRALVFVSIMIDVTHMTRYQALLFFCV